MVIILFLELVFLVKGTMVEMRVVIVVITMALVVVVVELVELVGMVRLLVILRLVLLELVVFDLNGQLVLAYITLEDDEDDLLEAYEVLALVVMALDKVLGLML